MRSRGQAMIEFNLALIPVALCLVLCGLLFLDEWNRLKCAHRVFETAHRLLVGQKNFSERVLTFEDEKSVTASGVCGKAREEVRLWRLESGPW